MHFRTVVLALVLVTATAARHRRTTRTTPSADIISLRSTSPTTHGRVRSPATTTTKSTPSTVAVATKQGNPTTPTTGTTSNATTVLAAATTIPNATLTGSTPSLPTVQKTPSAATTRISRSAQSTPAAPTSGSRKSTPTSFSTTPTPTVSTTKTLAPIVSILSTSTTTSVSTPPSTSTAETKPMAPVTPTTYSTTSTTANVTSTSATGSGQIEHTVVSNIRRRPKLETVADGVPNLANLVDALRSKRPMQSVAVSGQLLCNGEPATEVELKLYDHDTFTPNDLMATNSTDEDGRFRVAGYEHEFTQITPQLDILHSCGGKKDCLRKLTIYVPKNHVTKGDTPGQAFDIGSVELFGRFSGETTNCFQ